MSAFVALLATDGRAVAEAELARWARRLPAPPASVGTVSDGPFAAAWTPGLLRPTFARRERLVGVGDVRIDHPGDVRREAGIVSPDESDIGLLLAAYEMRGDASIESVVADFGFVVWDGRARRMVAARDALGVKPLFHGRDGRLLVIASRLGVFGEGERYDERWIAEFLLGTGTDPERTVWDGVRSLPPGGMLVAQGDRIETRRFWRAEDFAPADRADEREAAEAFRGLFAEAVRTRTDGDGETWAQLSGGLDSSSVVSMAATLSKRGEGPALGGTLTVVDALGDGDETRFSGAVLRDFGLRNEALHDPWPWEDDGFAPEALDEPRAHYPFWARDRRMCEVVRSGGGRVMLSGQGSDHYLDGPGTYAADLLARGRLRQAFREVALTAVARRQSFYRGFWHDALLPLLPARLASRGAGEALPGWIDPGFADRAGVRDHLPAMRDGRAPRGRLWHHQTARSLMMLPGFLERAPFIDTLEMRYPFLHRPLVEFGLRLPVSLRLRPNGGKWILREAMRGTLPEEVRTRKTKGGIDARVMWALGREAPRLRAMLRDPIVAQKGWISAEVLRAETERARQGETDNLPRLLSALALETWLKVRAGWWTPAEQRTTTAA